MVDIDPDWWKRIFDETYLITDARTVCDEDLTSREVDFLEEILNFERSWPILDLCGGQGRHSLELSRSGFQDVTVLDYSEILIDHGRKRAKEEGLTVLFVQNDARDTGLPSQRFRIILVMASSLGYLADEVDDERILCEAFRLLMPKGLLLLDLPCREFVLENLTPQSWHEADDDIVVCRQRRLDKDAIVCREVVISKSKGLIRDETYCTRLFSQEKIAAMLLSAGFSSVDIRGDFVSHDKRGDYGCMNNRMIVIAKKE
jgi:D-alanine-D-alanine ligase